MPEGPGMSTLDKVLEQYSLKNDDLVQASVEQLTHKQVQKARKGQRVTPNIQGKITRALNAVVILRGQSTLREISATYGTDPSPIKKFTQKDLFDY